MSAVTALGTRLARARRYCEGMVLSLAPGCRVTVRFGRIRIVHFLQGITELPGCVRLLSRCRCRGTACSGPAGLSTKANSTGGGGGLGLREAVHRSIT